MKVLMVNGSSHEGCTYTALTEIGKILEREGIEWEIFNVGGAPLRDCIGCGGCKNLDGACVFGDDIVNEFLKKASEADGYIFGSPVYFAHPSGRVISLLDRAFVAGKKLFMHKPGASIVSARRGGTTASYDVLNKYFGICQMPIVSSSYWNMVHGNTPEEVLKDEEGIQTMRNLGKNMAWLLKCIDLAKKNGLEIPQNEIGVKTLLNRGHKMIVIVAKSTVKKECLDEYKKIVKELVEKSQKEEGNISYVLHQDIKNPQNFVIIEKWRDQEAIDFHNGTEHFTRIVPMIGKLRDFSEVSLYEEVEF